MSFKKTGDWNKVTRLVGSLAKEMQDARNKSLKQWGLKAESIAKGHMGNQTLKWKPLKAATVAGNIRRGESTNILTATSDYFQAITSWHDGGSSYAGVKKIAKDSDGEEIANIAAVHEFGSEAANIPARPLWRPVFKETMEWYKRSNVKPTDFLDKNVKKYK